MHWTRWKNHGDPTFRKNDTYGSKRRVADSGYVFLFKPGHPLAMADGYVAEHRLVMWDAGLLILGDPRMYVHHKNEIRHDNRIENLEVKLDADHTREHVAERGYIINQYGTWPLRHT